MNAIEKSNKDLRLQESLSTEAQRGEKTKGRKHPLLKKVYLLFVFFSSSLVSPFPT